MGAIARFEDAIAWRTEPYFAPPEMLRPVGGARFPVVPLEHRGDAWPSLRDRWIALPAHPTILEAVDVTETGGAIVRYAALDWRWTPATRVQENDLLRWAAQLALAYAFVVKHVPAEDRGRFARPMVYVDLAGDARVAFAPCAPGDGDEMWPPELARTWPHAEPSALVYVIAMAVATLAADITQFRTTPLGEVIARCAQPDPAARPRSPVALSRELVAPRMPVHVRRSRAYAAGWARFEAGVGWLWAREPDRAQKSFELALELGVELWRAQIGRAEAMRRQGLPFAAWQPRIRSTESARWLAATARAAWRREIDGWPHVPWTEVMTRGAELEAARAFAEAIACYARSRECPAQQIAIARCAVELGRWSVAVDYATCALAADPARPDARILRARAWLGWRNPERALGDVRALLDATPDDGLAHYLHGRCLLGLGRPSEARVAFDRACTLSPPLLAALMMRRQVARSQRATRDATGVPFVQRLALPAHLAELGVAIAAGEVAGAIRQLTDVAYAADPDAQLVLGHCLAYVGRGEHARAAFGRARARFDDRLFGAPGDAALLAGRARAQAAIDDLDEVGPAEAAPAAP